MDLISLIPKKCRKRFFELKKSVINYINTLHYYSIEKWRIFGSFVFEFKMKKKTHESLELH